MKKQLLLWSMFIGIFAIGNSQKIDFVDVNFKNALLGPNSNVDINGDGILSNEELSPKVSADINGNGEIDESEAKAVMRLFIDNQGISDLSGIEKFPNLILLFAHNNLLTSVDLSSNVFLNYLLLDDNQIESIDVSNNIKLIDLSVDDNLLESIDVSNNVDLLNLELSDNTISNLDLSNNKILATLHCRDNNLTEIDLSINDNLGFIDLRNNPLKKIDISRNNQRLSSLYLTYSDLTSLDLSGNTNLKNLILFDNNLTELDLSDQNKLTSLSIGYNEISELDLSNQTMLESLSIVSTEIDTLDVSFCSLKGLSFNNNANLTTVLMKGQPLTYNTNSEELQVRLHSCPELEFICVDQKYIEDINSLLEDVNQTNVEVSDNCDDSEEDPGYSDIINLFPNPTTTGELNFSVIEPGVTLTSSVIYDLAGQVWGFAYHNNTTEFSGNYFYLIPGQYIIVTTTSAGDFTTYFVKN